MTGEITLRGSVLPIGGVKEKVLAAYRYGIRTIILPKENEKDLAEIPEDIGRQLEFRLVESMDEVLSTALVEPIPSVGLAKGGAPPIADAPSEGPLTH
jgi:ATP-dependent Lon protease